MGYCAVFLFNCDISFFSEKTSTVKIWSEYNQDNEGDIYKKNVRPYLFPRVVSVPGKPIWGNEPVFRPKLHVMIHTNSHKEARTPIRRNCTQWDINFLQISFLLIMYTMYQPDATFLKPDAGVNLSNHIQLASLYAFYTIFTIRSDICKPYFDISIRCNDVRIRKLGFYTKLN